MRYIASYYILTSDTWEFKFATLKQVSMERISFSLLFYIRRTKLNKAGEVPIFMRITVNGQRADASARRFIEPRLWNTAKGKAVENEPRMQRTEFLPRCRFRKCFTYSTGYGIGRSGIISACRS